MNKQKGFTLIEALITISIIGFLGSVAVPAFFDFMESEKVAQKTGSLIKEFKQESNTDEIITTKSVLSDIECLDGKKIIHINGKVYHIGEIDTWGDIKSIDCEE